MASSELDLRAVVARATFLRERLAPDGSPTTTHREIAAAEWERWRVAVEPEGADWFEKRFRWDGLDPSMVASAHVEDTTALNRELPAWAAVLLDISASARVESGATAAVDPSPIVADAPVPFEDLLLPAVVVARRMLCSRLGVTAEPLRFRILGIVSARAYRDLERALLGQVSRIAGETLQTEFDRFRPLGRSLSLLLDLPELEPAGDTHYRKFVAEHLETGWVRLPHEYPVLGRLIATAVELWADATAELLTRLAADSDDLAEAFGVPPEVCSFVLGLGDPHRHGRSVLAMEFAGGRKVLYKPKPLALEAAFNRLLAWCNARGASPALKVTTVLDRGEYGWVEHVEQLPCEDEAAAERFYRRAGMLLCLLHVLRATDCHYENLIAHGDQPVLIDAETLLYPDPQPLESPDGLGPGETGGDRLLTSTVLRTGFLPGWQAASDRLEAHDRSALGGGAPGEAARETLRWTRINTDDMHVRGERRALEAGGNIARIGDRALSAADYEAALTTGFESMYRLLIAHREDLCAPDGPLAAMRGQRVRFMYRPTRVYGALTAASFRPELLCSGVEYGVHLEQLARAFLVSREKPAAWPVFGAEVRALQQMDVPLFTVRNDTTDLELDDGSTLRNAFTEPSHDAMLELVAAMSEADLERQLVAVRAALHAKRARTPSGSADGRPADLALAPAPPLSADELVRVATALGLELERHALTDGREAVSWIGLTYLDGADRYQLDVLNDSLYDGCSGVALFLAALGRITGERRFASLSLRSLHGLRRRLRATDPGSRRVAARLYGLGGAVGLGSVIYGLVRVAGLLERDDLLDDAASLAAWLTPDVIADDPRLDVMSGAAGALLGLLALYPATAQPDALRAAAACGDHLLEHRVGADGHRAWGTVGERPLTGFSHGAAGIAYALVRLYAATGEAAYLDAAVEAIEYERSLFSERDGNWPDLRPVAAANRTRFPVKWCHGAAGIALARLGCRRIADLPGVASDVDAGLRATREHYLQDADFLCCGNLGRAETFLVAAAVTGDPEWEALAARGTAGVVGRAAERGGYRMFTAGRSYNPAFFHGTAGIGYQLLRLADPRLPSVLLWD